MVVWKARSHSLLGYTQASIRFKETHKVQSYYQHLVPNQGNHSKRLANYVKPRGSWNNHMRTLRFEIVWFGHTHLRWTSFVRWNLVLQLDVSNDVGCETHSEFKSQNNDNLSTTSRIGNKGSILRLLSSPCGLSPVSVATRCRSNWVQGPKYEPTFGLISAHRHMIYECFSLPWHCRWFRFESNPRAKVSYRFIAPSLAFVQLQK